MNRRAFPWIVVLVLAASLPCGRADEPPTAAALIRRIVTSWGDLEASLTAEMTVRRPGQEPTVSVLRILRAGSGTTRVDFLEPEDDRGKVILRVDDDTWLYLPKAERTVQVPTRRSPFAAGVLFDDEFASNAEDPDSRVEAGDDAWVLVTPIPSKRRKRTGTDRIFFDPDTLMPFRRETYTPSGKLLRTVYIDELRPWSGREIPWRIRYVDHLGEGLEATLTLVEASPLTGARDALFSRDRLGEPAGAGDR